MGDVEAGFAVVSTGIDAADDAKDDADCVEEFEELDVAGGDEGSVGMVDVGGDAA